ncbi:methyltransferase domain-containing protein [Halomonas sp. EGI 63088]|uniref:Methyltransferase domain-containing protein n=1 Tax=Halomonas flagellata TaxID=2920385 RepID=A0ABS9RXY9_9GAMM|nr:class I SAM-dependent methyltransferase [Halomonas flagellata]MCH4564684.1 methyltransferase domain-containing protein [Halomonas flagellata]
MQYQSFPGVKGSSDSLRKLAALRLPSLAGKRCLDVGCNEGFFAGYAIFDGAARAVGIDRSAAAIRKAQRRFPEAEFIQQSWETLPEGEYELITLLSALHYADDQEALIHRLMEQLSDDGLLVLEISMAPQAEDAWIQVERSIDRRFFPTRRKLARVLEPYAWKVIGHSVNQPGDPLQRYVVHVRKLKPCAYLLMGRPGSGKSTLARKLFKKARVPVISGDAFYQQVAQGKHDAPAPLQELISADFSTASIDSTTRKVFEAGHARDMARLWSASVGYEDFALDTYVPEAFQPAVCDAFAEVGYFPVRMEWGLGEGLMPRQDAEYRADAYAQYLATKRLPEMPLARVTRLARGDAAQQQLRWHLDSPVTGEELEAGAPVMLAGWILTLDGAGGEAEVYLDLPGGREVQAFNKPREDALKHVFGTAESVPVLWQEQPCGFRIEVPVSLLTEGVEIGILLDGQPLPLARVSLEMPDQSDTSGIAGRLFKKLTSRPGS